MGINRKKFELLKKIIDEETKFGSISMNKLHRKSKQYTETGKKISRDTIARYAKYFDKDIFFKKKRGFKGSEIISRKNLDKLQNVRDVETWKKAVTRVHYIKAVEAIKPILFDLKLRLQRGPIKETTEYWRASTEHLVYRFSLAIEKALEYIPQEKESLYRQYVEKMLDSVRNTKIEKTPEGFVLRRRKTGEMFGVYNSRKNRLFIMK